MTHHFISLDHFIQFFNHLVSQKKVFGPVAKKNKFIFDHITHFNQLRLDYDVTILPPKKFFFPPKQDILKFDGNKYKSCIQTQDKIIFGVHFYDIKAIDQLDFLFNENNPDQNYLAHRKTTTLVGSNIQNVSTRAFWGSVGQARQAKGHDAFITKIDTGYVLEVITGKGKNLLTHGNFVMATSNQINLANQTNQKIKEGCPEKLAHDSDMIAQKVRHSFKNNELWEGLAKDCFSCGSCNTTCPTCYCFDVQDNWNLDQKTGTRTRYWDSCMTVEFAKISHGGGISSNFREFRRERFRHRMMRKFTYLNDKLEGPACVGCGRCSQACTADIADPVKIIQKIMEV